MPSLPIITIGTHQTMPFKVKTAKAAHEKWSVPLCMAPKSSEDATAAATVRLVLPKQDETLF